MIFGAAAGLIDDVVLDGVRLELRRHTDWPARRDLRPWGEREPTPAGAVPGFHVERAAGVVLRDCEVVFAGGTRGDFSGAVTAVDASGLRIEGLRGPTITADPRPEHGVGPGPL